MDSRTQKETTSHPSKDIAHFITELSYSDLSEDAIQLVERCFIDTFGVTLAGSSATAGIVAKNAMAELYTGDTSAAVASSSTSPIPEAAFINSMAAHALDYDDVTGGMDGHPSATMVGPIIALGEFLGASGKDLIKAYVAGFEAQCYLAAPNLRGRSGPGLHTRDWHPTAIYGTFGATAASASLLNLSKQETQNALNITASLSSGLKKNFGSLTKPMHVGKAASSGIRAAFLAKNGQTADPYAIRDGFFPVYLGVDDCTDQLPNLGHRWAIEEDRVAIKKYPSCYGTHSAIYATQELVNENKIQPDQIQEIKLTISSTMENLLAHDNPESEEQAKFSIPYTAAVAVLYDYIGIDKFKPEIITSSEVQSMQKKVIYEVDSSYPVGTPCKTTVEITLASEESYSMVTDTPPGTPEKPLSENELQLKFVECAKETINQEAAEEVYEMISDLKNLDDINSLMNEIKDSKVIQ